MNRILEWTADRARIVATRLSSDLPATCSRPNVLRAGPSSQSFLPHWRNVAEIPAARMLITVFHTTHVLGLEVVLPDGSLLHLGGKCLTCLATTLWRFCRSEARLGIARK